ncbi:MAG: HlyD family efflux transporter periplasmic adaptor subunit [Eubacteriales bacterium]|nr:HlyD family efflux transporter periplasmic adaptor subunit [Eubacteriales bacterium]
MPAKRSATPQKMKMKIKPRFFIVLAVALGLVAWGMVALVRLFLPPTVEWGRLDTDQEISAVVLRDETVVPAQAQARVMCIAAEGEMVTNGGTVAMLYTSGYNDKNMQNLITLQQKIKDYQENNILANVINADLETLNTQISAKLEEIRQCTAQLRTGSLLTYERELKDLMTRRQALMKQIITPDDYLQKLYDQETGLQSKIDETRSAAAATADGYISYIFDNLESQLTVANIDQMTPKIVTTLEKQVLKGDILDFSSGLRAAGEPLCRIVNPTHWYALVVMGKNESTMTEGATCEVTFDGISETVEAKVVRYVPEGGQVLAVLEMTKGAQSVTSMRRITGHVGRSAEGFKVPVKAVQTTEGGGYAVQVKTAQGVTAVEVEVMASDNRQAIVTESKGSGGVLTVGQRVILP